MEMDIKNTRAGVRAWACPPVSACCVRACARLCVCVCVCVCVRGVSTAHAYKFVGEKNKRGEGTVANQ